MRIFATLLLASLAVFTLGCGGTAPEPTRIPTPTHEITLEEAVEYSCALETDYDVTTVIDTQGEDAAWFDPGKIVVEGRVSQGKHFHEIVHHYDLDGTLLRKQEFVWLDRVHYKRNTHPDAPHSWDDWTIDTGVPTFPDPCFREGMESLERVGTRHYVVREPEEDLTAEIWIDRKGRPTRMLLTLPPNQTSVTFTGYDETNIITAPVVE